MRKPRLFATSFAFVSIMFVYLQDVQATETWQRIEAPSTATVVVNGNSRNIFPGCAMEGDSYAFYFKKGKVDKLAFFFNGGGACWDATTCLASLQTARSAYVPTDDISHNNPNVQGGMMDLSNPQNPYADWNIVYIPYCTGDVHFGSKNTSYTVAPGVSKTIRHRGFDNFLYVRDWVTRYYRNIDASPEKVLVTGSSAGAYGATLNYAHIKSAFPHAKGFLLADAGSGVLTESLMQTAIRGSSSSWNFDANFAQFVPNLASTTSLPALAFTPAIFAALSSAYPKDRFSQYTTVHDLIQVSFYNIMNNSSDMSSWFSLGPAQVGAWTGTMLQVSAKGTELSNYRLYIAPGCKHTVLRSNEMYSTSVNGTSFLSWFSALTRGNAGDWDNLNCTASSCQYQALSQEDIVSCTTM